MIENFMMNHRLCEISINQLYRDVTYLYNRYKSHYTSLSSLTQAIAEELDISVNDVLQILQVQEHKHWVSIKLDEGLRISDLRKHSGISKFTDKWRLDRQKRKGSGAKSVKIIGMKVNRKQGYITFVFKSKPTYKSLMPAVAFPDKNKKKYVRAYTQEIRIVDFFKWAETKPHYVQYELTQKEVKEILQVADIQVACNCMSFQFQGMNYIVSLFDASIYPETRPPRKWNKYHNDDNFLCKHLDILLSQGMNIYINNMTSMINKYLKNLKSNNR